MNNEIDLSKFAPCSDLADEIVTSSNGTKDYSVINKVYEDVNISYITIHNDNIMINKYRYIVVESVYIALFYFFFNILIQNSIKCAKILTT
jgi:hypothetical protein